MPIGCEKARYYKTFIFHIERISQNHMESGKHKGIAYKKAAYTHTEISWYDQYKKAPRVVFLEVLVY